MKIWKIFPLAFAIFFTGCALIQTPRLSTSAKTDVALLQYKKIAVIKFKNPKNESAGQEASDILALGFVKLGYNVVGSAQIAELIDQGDVYTSGLTPQIKARLKSSGIDSVVTGTVNEYFCSRSESVLPLLKECGDNHCSVTVSARMLDLDSGEIVWGATGSDAQDGRWITADSVLRSLMQKLQETIPNISLLRSTVSQTGGKSQAPQIPAQRSAR
jgi:hypothetical protein